MKDKEKAQINEGFKSKGEQLADVIDAHEQIRRKLKENREGD